MDDLEIDDRVLRFGGGDMREGVEGGKGEETTEENVVSAARGAATGTGAFKGSELIVIARAGQFLSKSDVSFCIMHRSRA